MEFIKNVCTSKSKLKWKYYRSVRINLAVDNLNEFVVRKYFLNEELLRPVYLIDMTCSFCYYCCYWLTRIGKKSNIFV